MRKLALAIAISAAASTAAQAAQTSVFTGTLNSMDAGSSFSAGGAYADAAIAPDLDYTLTYVANSGAFVSLSLALDGSFTTVGDPAQPPFSQQTWTFTNAVYDLGVNQTNSAGFNGDWSQMIGDVTGGGGMTGFVPGASTVSGTGDGTGVACTGGSCESFDGANLVSRFDLDFILDPNNTFAEISHDFQIEFASTSGGTGYALTSVAAVPVPAAAWLFGSALVGLVGVGRRRK
jgi:hypothetical protein